MASLLGLPREIRDEIYSYLLDEYTHPPQHPQAAGQRSFNNESRHGGARLNSIRYPVDSLPRHYENIVAANHQIYSEVTELVDRRLASDNLTAELDIMFKGYQSWPTWTQFPSFIRPSALTEDNEESQTSMNVNVNLRIFSTEGFRSNDGWPRQPGTNFRDLLMLLRQYLQHGPSFGQTSEAEGGNPNASSTTGIGDVESEAKVEKVYKINTLTVDVAFEDIYSPATHPETVHQLFKALKEVANSGVFFKSIKTIRAHARFFNGDEKAEWENEWPMSESQVFEIVYRWNNIGLMVTEKVGSKRFLAVI